MDNRRDVFLETIGNKSIICFGAGWFFERAYYDLACLGIEIDACIDNNEMLWDKQKHGVTIHSVDWIKTQDIENIVVLITNKTHFEEMAVQIRTYDVPEENIFVWPLVGRVRNPKKSYWKNRLNGSYRELYSRYLSDEEVTRKIEGIEKNNLLVLPRIPVMITTRCTLRCEQCNNLMPYYNKPMDYPASDVISWIQALVDAVDEWIVIELVGGEPFIYKELGTVLRYVLGLEKILRVELTTNATVIPKEEILELLQNEKVEVHISDYGKLVPKQKFIDVMNVYNITYKVFEDMQWVAVGGIEERGRLEAETREQYWACPSAKLCKTVLNGRLFACSRAASLYEIGITPNAECVNLVGNDKLREELRQYLLLDNAIACNHCDNAIETPVYVEAGIQKKR